MLWYLIIDATNEPGMLNEVHSMLRVLVQRVEGTEKELKEIKGKISSQRTPIHKRKDISPIVRVSLGSYSVAILVV